MRILSKGQFEFFLLFRNFPGFAKQLRKLQSSYFLFWLLPLLGNTCEICRQKNTLTNSPPSLPNFMNFMLLSVVLFSDLSFKIPYSTYIPTVAVTWTILFALSSYLSFNGYVLLLPTSTPMEECH